ncbi:FAD-binding protein [Flavihumibacter profundi]|uniref:FAD-binding protein n=1 Tax=Flavihumibacter profundi TaxID=2716883 RepID=UPI001CC33F8B|nr:FAD-binding protein [Flavihumibacter profundi]MBZ5856805.1 FAD-binding protein [Flavihumibacter profundi]
MDKREFLRTSSVLLGGTILLPYFGCKTNKQAVSEQPLSNWSGNLTYSTTHVHYPKTVGQVQDIVRKCKQLRALGSRHSFNTIADSTANQVSLQEMNHIVALDKSNHTVTVEAGMRYGELAPYLHENGYALHNLASLPHITIEGACATATHGSGMASGNLSTAVSAIEFVNASGDLVVLSRQNDRDQFPGAVVGLGTLGVVIKITLNLLPTFEMKQFVYLNLPMRELEKNMYAILSSGYSVSLFTDWKNKNVNEVWIKMRADDPRAASMPAEFFGATLATRNMHPVADQPAENCTPQMGVAGPWYERMPHFKMGFKPSAGKELQAEYFVPLERGYEAMMAVETLHEKISPHLFISEIRTIKGDDLWMSPCYKNDCLAIHTTWKQETEIVNGLLPMVEQQLAPFNARPHWAKLFAMPPAVLQSRIERLSDFKNLVNQYDPNGKFRNDFIHKNLWTS